MGNMNVRFVFRQDSADDAEKWSRFFGTQATVKRTFQTQDGQQTGMSSNREVQAFRIAPDTIKDLSIGECIFGIKTEKLTRKTRMPFGAESSRPQYEFPTQRSVSTEDLPSAPFSAVDLPARPSLTEHCASLSDLVSSANQPIEPKNKEKL